MANEKQLVIEVKDKIATLKSKNFNLVGGNSDYDVVFEFDKDWENLPTKTAVFVFGKEKPVFKVFVGNICNGVSINNASMCLIGVFAGNVKTTTPAMVECVYRSILDEANGTPEPPKEDVYNKIMELLDKAIQAHTELPTGGKTGQVLKKKSDEDYDTLWEDDISLDTNKIVPVMTEMDKMMFEKFGTGEKNYFFSQANWDDLQRYNRAYVQAYDSENDLRLGEDGKGLYALRAICRYGAGTIPRYPWMKKSDWVKKYKENNPQTALSDEEIIANHPPKDTDYEYMATLIERQPNGFIKVPTGFPTDKTEAQMEGYVVPKKYVDKIRDIASAAVPKIEAPDNNRYAYTTYQNSKGESLIALIKTSSNATPDVTQPLVRRRVNGAVGTLKIPQADDDASSKFYVDSSKTQVQIITWEAED